MWIYSWNHGLCSNRGWIVKTRKILTANIIWRSHIRNTMYEYMKEAFKILLSFCKSKCKIRWILCHRKFANIDQFLKFICDILKLLPLYVQFCCFAFLIFCQIMSFARINIYFFDFKCCNLLPEQKLHSKENWKKLCVLAKVILRLICCK